MGWKRTGRIILKGKEIIGRWGRGAICKEDRGGQGTEKYFTQSSLSHKERLSGKYFACELFRPRLMVLKQTNKD